MNSTPAAVGCVVVLLIIGGFIGYFLHKCPNDPTPTTIAQGTLDSLRTADSLAWAFLRDTVKIPVPTRVHAATQNLAAADTTELFRILDAEPSPE